MPETIPTPLLPPELSGWKLVRGLDGKEHWELSGVDYQEPDVDRATFIPSTVLITQSLAGASARLGLSQGRIQTVLVVAGVGLALVGAWKLLRR